MFSKPIKIFIGFLLLMYLLVMVFIVLELNKLKEIKVNHFYPQAVSDGTYTGEASTYLIKVKVSVVVKDHEITQIDVIDYQHSRGEEAIQIVDSFVKENHTNVDNISGATASSIVFKAAVSDALEKGLESNDPN